MKTALLVLSVLAAGAIQAHANNYWPEISSVDTTYSISPAEIGDGSQLAFISTDGSNGSISCAKTFYGATRVHLKMYKDGAVVQSSSHNEVGTITINHPIECDTAFGPVDKKPECWTKPVLSKLFVPLSSVEKCKEMLAQFKSMMYLKGDTVLAVKAGGPALTITPGYQALMEQWKKLNKQASVAN